ncbi:MAG: proline dehydrogenase [Candidatus Marinimicrobia bacterium]|jgi:proline dehydrogenase|nr:proline dehydrogenase [Candidatus Neomarinimicrobiota bacterium]MBT3682654.1 proline dehydrogenase [Candidatus Neomarinimicrobiota bacterium]MBT3759691.1 proline dehydrogenase [Candidatus Neomarinimicrobiota bacterium]MBT3894438.1 proline dehydrogenase [Candidatus Neomarinimicrobiota bacterium]MBT4172480.1 proline dehydrogenase [Candidatus Neomarinimicrobiota bacterium]
MIRLFNQIILFFVPFLPKFFVSLIAGKYVAGETKDEALRHVKSLNEKGFSATIDILGEHVQDKEKAKRVSKSYLDLYDEINNRNLDCNVSIKPTHIGLGLDPKTFDSNLSSLVQKAKEYNNFLRIDMENSPYTDSTIEAFKNSSETYNLVGTVFQAYLYRTENDIESLSNDGFNFRLCKGIYHEDPDIAIQNRDDINKNFLKVLKLAFNNGAYVGIATHDLKLLEDVYSLIRDDKIDRSQFEFQVLYGVPMSGWLEKHLENGYKVRVYVPFGPEWYEYSIRRLKENPNIVGYVLSNFLRKK